MSGDTGTTVAKNTLTLASRRASGSPKWKLTTGGRISSSKESVSSPNGNRRGEAAKAGDEEDAGGSSE
jgi:hypothetical protein